jgi:predicted metal-dependent hydrolase
LVVRVIRSARRKRTVSARLINWYTLEVRAPMDIPEDELQRIIARFRETMRRRREAMRTFGSNEDLQRRAERLNDALYGGAARWRSIRYVPNQNTRWGSCSPTQGTIRISHRLATAPSFVLDYVIAHELAHLLEPGHTPAFWKLVYRYPRAERAIGYLMALRREEDATGDPIAPED